MMTTVTGCPFSALCVMYWSYLCARARAHARVWVASFRFGFIPVSVAGFVKRLFTVKRVQILAQR